MSATELKRLEKYSACDVSDVLLKLNIPKAGFLPDLVPQVGDGKRLVGEVSTANFVDRGPNSPDSRIPPNKHWVDLVTPGSVLIQLQANAHRNAILGGIMAARLDALGVHGIITHGRIRDIDELEEIGVPVWAKGRSTVGQGLCTKCESVNQPLVISGVVVGPGDICVADRNGVVIIPRNRLQDVLLKLPKLIEQEDKIMAAVKKGMSVQEAFTKFR